MNTVGLAYPAPFNPQTLQLTTGRVIMDQRLSIAWKNKN